MKKRLALATVLALAAIPVSASAQTWLSDRRLREGPGIRSGDLELHPAFGGEFGYDSNYYQRAPGEDGGVVGAYRLRLTPSFSVSTLGGERRGSGAERGAPPTVMFNASAFLSFNALFAGDSGGQEKPFGSHGKSLTALDYGANLMARVLPYRPISFDLGIDWLYLTEPSNSPEDRDSFNRGALRAGPGIVWRPGGGLFEWRLGYEMLYNYFDAESFKTLENIQNALVTRGVWRFLPRTALLYDAAYRNVHYTRHNVPLGLTDGDLVRARVGLNGLITPRISLLGMVGWEASYYKRQPRNADSILAQVEAKYFVMAPPSLEAAAGGTPSASTGLSTVALGYTHEIANSYLNSFLQKDRAYLNAIYFLGGAFVASATGGFSFVRFPTGPDFNAFTQRRIDARLFAEYRFSDSLGVNATGLFDKNMSDRLVSRQNPDAPPVDNLDFTRWQAYLGVRWFM